MVFSWASWVDRKKLVSFADGAYMLMTSIVFFPICILVERMQFLEWAWYLALWLLFLLMYVTQRGGSSGGRNMLYCTDDGGSPEFVIQRSCSKRMSTSDDVPMLLIAEIVVASPLPQFSCCSLAMPVRWMYDIYSRAVGFLVWRPCIRN